jgi:hypothetical protein
MRRVTAAGIVGLIAGVILGWGRGPAPPPVECPTIADRPAMPARPSRGAPAVPAPRVDAPGEAPDVVFVEPMDEAQPALGEGPVPWPADLPRGLRPEETAVDLARIAAGCGLERGRQAVDCSEPPCLLQVALDGAVEFSDLPGARCPGWRERFGDGVAMSSNKALCADGRIVTMAVVGPFSPEASPPDDPDDPWRGNRRLTARMNAWADQIGCRAPVELRVENRLGWRLQWVPADR